MMWKQITVLLAVAFLADAYRLPRAAIQSPVTDFTEIGNGLDPIINLRQLSMYLLQRLPSVETDKILKSLAKDSYDRSLNEQIQGFHDIMNLLVKGAWAQVIRRNEKETFEVKSHVFEAFLLQQVSAIEADKIMNALNKIAYGATDAEKNEGFRNVMDLLAEGATARMGLERMGPSPMPIAKQAETDIIGKLRTYLLRRIPSMEADRIVNLFGRYMQAQNIDEKREANRQLMDLLVDGTLALISLDGVSLSPTKVMGPPMENKMYGIPLVADIERMQNALVQRMPLDEANRILNAVLKIITGETNDIRDEGEWEIFDMLVEGAQAKEALRSASMPTSPMKVFPMNTRISTPMIETTTDMPTYFITFV